MRAFVLLPAATLVATSSFSGGARPDHVAAERIWGAREGLVRTGKPDSIAHRSSDGTTTFGVSRRLSPGDLEEHSRFDEILLVRSGTGAIEFGDAASTPSARIISRSPGEYAGGAFTRSTRVSLAAGDLFRVPSGVAHRLFPTGREPLEYLTMKIRRAKVALDVATEGETPLALRPDHVPAANIWQIRDLLARGSAVGRVIHAAKDRQTAYMVVHRRMTSEIEEHARWDDIVIVRAGQGRIEVGHPVSSGAAKVSRLRAPGEWLGGIFRTSSSYSLKTGDVFRIPAGQGHRFIPAGDTPFEYLIIKVRRPELPLTRQ